MTKKSVEELINEVLGDSITDSEHPNEAEITRIQASVDKNTVTHTYEGVDGKAGIKNGRLVVEYPRGMGKYPTITPGFGTRLMINGQEHNETAILTEDIQVEIILEEKKPESTFVIDVSEDEMVAYITVQAEAGRKYRLPDQEQTLHLVLRTEVAQEIPPPPLALDQVVDKLKSLGIKYGIDLEAIKGELAAPTGEKVIIARGKPVVPSQDGYIEYFFNEKVRFEKKLQAEERVDYWDKGEFQSVDVGAILAIKHPPVQGRSGITVTCQEVPAKEPADVEILVGDGVRLINNGQKAVALVSGRPVLAGARRVIKILPQLVIPGDVDINTGHVQFKGDVVVRGNVLEGLSVRATGKITVLGHVYSAHIMAGDDVVINRNLVGGTVTAGGEAAFLSRIIPLITQLKNTLPLVINSVMQIKNNPMFSVHDLNIKGDGNLIKLLIDMKFKEIPKIIENLRGYLKALNYQPEIIIKECIRLLTDKLTGLGPLTIQSLDELTDIEKALDEIIKMGEEMSADNSNVIVQYSQNAIIEATGAIYVTGTGSYHTNMYAGKEIIINGVCRGGEVRAAGDITVSQLGSASAVVTKIETKEGSEIRANIAYPNVFLKIDRQAIKVNSPIQPMRCILGENKSIIVTSN